MVWRFEQPFYLLLNLAVGGGGFPRKPDGSTPAQGTFSIDYVATYRWTGVAAAPARPPLRATASVKPVTPFRQVAVPGYKCMDVAGRNKRTVGLSVQLWDCKADEAYQKWRQWSNGSMRSWGLCLDVAGGVRNGSKVQVAKCNGGPAQRWRVTAKQTITIGGKCLDTASQTSRGARLQIAACNGSWSQRFPWR